MSERTNREIKETLGEIPLEFQSLEFDEIAHDHLWEVFKKFELGESNIPGKYKHLMALCAAASMRCPYCTYYHTGAAKMMGATENEINEASFLALLTQGFSTYLHGREIPLDKFKEVVNRVSAYMQKKAA
jgi:AhpD family alkylhydroperoxidase